MEDIFEKKIKEFLPYIIIIAAVYLFVPSIIVLTHSNGVFNQVVYMGIFPLTAFGCSFAFSYKKRNDFFLSLVAPVIYIPSMLLYGNIRDSVVNSLIYLVSYFICAYIGLVVGDMVSAKPKSTSFSVGDTESSTKAGYQRKRVPKKIRPDAAEPVIDDIASDDIQPIEKFDIPNDDYTAEDYMSDTDDDINAILDEIHNRQ